MDLRLNEEQEMIRQMARDFLRNECSPAFVRAMEEDPQGYSPEMWKSMAELGWMGLPFPEEHGGFGNSFLDLCILVEEQGRFRLPAPFFSTVVLCGLPIARFGRDDQKKELLGSIANGERIMAYADTEPGASWDASGIRLKAASADGGGYRLEGTKLFIPYAHVADNLLVAARTGGPGEDGLTLFIVDARAAGISYEPLKTIGSDHQQKITFEGVRVFDNNILGKKDGGGEIVRAINEWGAAAKCAEMVGGAKRVLEMSLEYARQRVQFGHPIGTFQAVQHHCANMALDVEGSQFIAYEAIWRLSEGMDASTEVSMAKAWVSEAYQRVCTLGHQIHGAIGFTKDHDMQLFFRHARASELAFGDGDYHRERVARRLELI